MLIVKPDVVITGESLIQKSCIVEASSVPELLTTVTVIASHGLVTSELERDDMPSLDVHPLDLARGDAAGVQLLNDNLDRDVRPSTIP